MTKQSTGKRPRDGRFPRESLRRVRHPVPPLTDDELLSISAARRLIASGEARELRLAAGLTQAEVAATAGVAHTSVCLWENGRFRPNRENAAKYGRVLLLLEAATKQ